MVLHTKVSIAVVDPPGEIVMHLEGFLSRAVRAMPGAFATDAACAFQSVEKTGDLFRSCERNGNHFGLLHFSNLSRKTMGCQMRPAITTLSL